MKFMPKFISPVTDAPPRHLMASEAQLLQVQSHDGLLERLTDHTPTQPTAVYTTRLEKELRIIEDKNACGYFLIVADYVNWARKNSIVVGPGRGSGPCSLVGFALGITKVDPIKHQLPFERFLNPDKNSAPDFDLDFCDERRREVLTYIRSKYGSDHVAHISSDNAKPLKSRLVIGDRPLAEVIPLHPVKDSEIPATKMTIKQISDAGLIQFNVINQNALRQMQHSVRKLAKQGETINVDKIPLDDHPTYTLLSTGRVSNSIFPNNENYLTTLTTIQPCRFEELCAVIAMHQPHFQRNLSAYVEGKQNRESINYVHPALRKFTEETYGLILYQEQVIQISHELAGFSLGQGDLLRRALQKPNHKQINAYKTKFIVGAVNSGILQTEALEIFEYMADSGKYCFNKSHAVAYSIIAYQTAWLKLHELS